MRVDDALGRKQLLTGLICDFTHLALYHKVAEVLRRDKRKVACGRKSEPQVFEELIVVANNLPHLALVLEILHELVQFPPFEIVADALLQPLLRIVLPQFEHIRASQLPLLNLRRYFLDFDVFFPKPDNSLIKVKLLPELHSKRLSAAT